jgi:hypothetical protein
MLYYEESSCRKDFTPGRGLKLLEEDTVFEHLFGLLYEFFYMNCIKYMPSTVQHRL